jgi:hypothetical protein
MRVSIHRYIIRRDYFRHPILVTNSKSYQQTLRWVPSDMDRAQRSDPSASVSRGYISTERDTPKIKLTPGGSATEAVHMARPEGHDTPAGDTREPGRRSPRPKTVRVAGRDL